MFNVIFGKVARLQLQVYEQLSQLKETGRYPNIKDALDELNSKLMDVTKVGCQINCNILYVRILSEIIPVYSNITLILTR